MPSTSLTTERCCGKSRTAGDLYLEVAHSPNGLPIEHFIWCPPQPVDMKALGASNIGVHLLPAGALPDAGAAVRHVIDFVGADSYPNVWDFLAEGEALGFSRKIQASFDFSKLSPKSWVFFVHPRAHISEGVGSYLEEEPQSPVILRCPTKVEKHRVPDLFPPPPDICGRLWKEDLREGPGRLERFDPAEKAILQLAGQPAKHVDRLRRRVLPCGHAYAGFVPPEGVKAEYTPAIFAAFPIGKLVGVRAKDGSHEKKLEKARRSSLPVEEADV